MHNPPNYQRSKNITYVTKDNIKVNKYIVLPKKIYQKLFKEKYPINNGYDDIKYSFFIANNDKKKETCDIQCFDLLIASSKNNKWWPVVIPYTTIFTYNYKDKKINQLNEITKIQYV